MNGSIPSDENKGTGSQSFQGCYTISRKTENVTKSFLFMSKEHSILKRKMHMIVIF